VLYRLLRFHLVDNTRGEPPFWGIKDIRRQNVRATVSEVSADVLTLQVAGDVLLATAPDPAQAKIGFEASLQGTLRLDRAKGTLAAFDLIAVGEHWGQGPFTPNPRPGRAPLGILFSLTTGESGVDVVPPQGAREWNGYLRADRD
jgi:hypothetical protein